MAELARLATISVEEISGLKGRRGAALKKAGIETVADLLMHVPRRYIDRSRVEPMALLPVGSEVTVIGKVTAVSVRRPRRGLVIVEATVDDGTGPLKAVWFNQGFRERQLPVGTEIALSGKVERFRGRPQMKSPDVDVLSADAETLRTGRVVPIHSSVGEVTPGWMRRAVHNALLRSRPIPDPVPAEILERHGLMARDGAFADIHFPEEVDRIDEARRRLVFDELFRLEVALAIQKRRQMHEAKGVAHSDDGGLVGRFVAGLPYELTGAQVRVLEEIRADMLAVYPMHRLLQGEVGSGKTVVAVATLLRGISGGFQGAVMAPTEVLAGQHFLAVSALLEMAGMAPAAESLGMDSLFSTGSGPGVRMALLTSSQVLTNFAAEASRDEVMSWIGDGKLDLVVGTHALIQEGVHFSRLGVAVVDEQHRFGVSQRVTLKEKGGDIDPDLLIMTATPIPRTLSMTLYGDLDVSVIDELPPGRTLVETLWLGRTEEGEAWAVVKEQVGAGRQAFVVCPLVEESAKIEAASATAEYERLQSVFPDLEVGLIHGQLHSRDKESVMSAFRAGAIDVLVATTVIEVGIDVPNATVMVIEDADRFGLSQLHQLRGRVGRGEHGGTCVLLAEPTTPEGEARIAAMLATTDGFRLAEEDLRIRGQGTVFGTRQSGVADLKLADLLRDFETLVDARREGFALVDRDPELAGQPQLRAEIRALLGDEVEWLFVS
ncbi:MAG: ATP-dependent DNA helicase RecG [Acidimicrobiia bacterium]|nr:ATP-dependent DNA helicase RecG [Acidimicrobiia bacterium]